MPPMMTLLDDYEGLYKLQFIQFVNAMLEHVPVSLLHRTGISELILAVWFGLFFLSYIYPNVYIVPKSRPHLPPLALHVRGSAGCNPRGGESHRTHDRAWLGTSF